MDTEQANLTNLSLKLANFSCGRSVLLVSTWENNPCSFLPCSVLQSALRLACLAELLSIDLLLSCDKIDGASSRLFFSIKDQNVDILEQHKEGCSVFWLHASLPRLALSPGSESVAGVVSGKDFPVLFYLEIIVWRLGSPGPLEPTSSPVLCPCSQIVMLK